MDSHCSCAASKDICYQIEQTAEAGTHVMPSGERYFMKRDLTGDDYN
jgi:hypothetical protein